MKLLTAKFTRVKPAMRSVSLALLAAVVGLSIVPAATAGAVNPITTPTRTKVATVPMNHVQVNGEGEILTSAMALYNGKRYVMLGGDFESLKLPNGTIRQASKFAIVNLNDGNDVAYAASNISGGYVYGTYAHASRLYISGSFTSVNGQARNRVAAFDLSHNLTGWNPPSNGLVRSITVNDQSAFYGSGGTFRAVTTARAAGTGTTQWTKAYALGDVRTVYLHPNKVDLYVGGLFETFGGVTQHGLVKIKTSNGANYAAFAPRFRPDSGVGEKGSWDGDCILSLSFDAAANRVIVGSGGAKRNQLSYLTADTGSGTLTAWNEPARAGALRNSEGDVQSVALIGDIVAMGYHRGHVDSNPTWRTKRNLTFWNRANGGIQTWDAGLYGGIVNGNRTNSNGGVHTMTYDATSKKVLVGGSFKGYGDPYNNTGGTDLYGAPGTERRGITVFTVQ